MSFHLMLPTVQFHFHGVEMLNPVRQHEYQSFLPNTSSPSLNIRYANLDDLSPTENPTLFRLPSLSSIMRNQVDLACSHLLLSGPPLLIHQWIEQITSHTLQKPVVSNKHLHLLHKHSLYQLI